jgi:hypothetical protein
MQKILTLIAIVVSGALFTTVFAQNFFNGDKTSSTSTGKSSASAGLAGDTMVAAASSDNAILTPEQFSQAAGMRAKQVEQSTLEATQKQIDAATASSSSGSSDTAAIVAPPKDAPAPIKPKQPSQSTSISNQPTDPAKAQQPGADGNTSPDGKASSSGQGYTGFSSGQGNEKTNSSSGTGNGNGTSNGSGTSPSTNYNIGY